MKDVQDEARIVCIFRDERGREKNSMGSAKRRGGRTGTVGTKKTGSRSKNTRSYLAEKHR
jgi:hypothetical protein